jgi:hypothetical protein
MSDPLKVASILQQVFTFLPGHYLFIGAVCREWRAVYAGMKGQQLNSISLFFHKERMICHSKTTFHSAAVASPTTITLAIDSGLVIHDNSRLQLAAGLFADMEVMTVLQELGVQFSSTAVKAAALSGRLKILKYLVREQQCKICDIWHILCDCAACNAYVDMLHWLRQERNRHIRKKCCNGRSYGSMVLLRRTLLP